MTESGPSLMALRDVARHLQVHPSTLYRLVKTGVVTGFKVGKQWRFAPEDLDRFLAGQKSKISDPTEGL
jgi:excisionase family DNA binding protein